MGAILQARRKANLTAAEVAHAVGRAPNWLSLAEVGAVRVAPEEEKTVLVAIARLERFAETVATAKEKLTVDLKLPPVVLTRGGHAP